MMMQANTAQKAILLAIAIGFSTSAVAIQLNEVARFNVNFAFNSDLDTEDEITDDNAKYIGTNPLGVAWNGTKLYLAGHDNFGSSLLPVGLIEVLNPTQTGIVGLVDADFSDNFGTIFQPTGRGYTGLELSGNRLAASYDNGNATDNGIQLFDTTTNSLVWDLGDAGITGRGGSGVAFDPGFNSSTAGQGVAWTQFGSGRRALQSIADGSTLFSLSGPDLGFQWIPDVAPGGNLSRDIAFDPNTGDMYVRRNNDVDAADRDGSNSTTNRRTIFDDASDAGAFKLGQKLEFIGGTDDGDLIIYNDSVTSTVDQEFDSVIKVIDTDGVAQTVTYNLLGGEVVGDIDVGNGIYDFDYDPVSNTLAILDFDNRDVYIFEVASAATVLTGDYNGDLTVDAADYTVWRDTLGQSVINPFDGADGNGNGVVDSGDYDEWVANYGMSSSSAATSSVPEPTSLLIVSIGASVLLGYRRI